MEIIIISIVAFLAAILTFFSGFGLGTLLTPVLLFFFPANLAIALTGIVHFVNNLTKMLLVGRFASRSVLVRFGIPAILAALIGAWSLSRLSEMDYLFSYQWMDAYFYVTPLNLVIAILLIFFALYELLPFFRKVKFGKEKLPIGGLLSGFFGGLSGHQGALRSAFLIKMGLSKEGFIGTGVIIACFVDVTRLTVYANRFSQGEMENHLTLLISASLSAIAGALIGRQLLKKITIEFVQQLVGFMLIIISIALGLGWI